MLEGVAGGVEECIAGVVAGGVAGGVEWGVAGDISGGDAGDVCYRGFPHLVPHLVPRLVPPLKLALVLSLVTPLEAASMRPKPNHDTLTSKYFQYIYNFWLEFQLMK